MGTVDVAAIPDRVAAGAEHLDREAPGWWQDIDLEDLDLASDCRCILGQVIGEYTAALDELKVCDGEGLGFDAVMGDYDDPIAEVRRRDAEYAALTAEWKRVIEARRAQAGA